MHRAFHVPSAVYCIVAAALVLALVPAVAHAQYFGRNKVQYRSFKFQVLKTEHFDIYYYPEEAEGAAIVARMAERWRWRLTRFFSHDLRGRQALILYAAPAHFRQTNAIEGLVGEGTGGATEALKRRIVLPMAGSLADTDHVLGHEMVHAFQFDMTGADPRESEFSLPGILQFPLWFAEGMAEYLSIGPVHAQTAMWLRDAALTEKLPHVKDLDDPKLFPYRWGHAFWAYIGATYGDRAVVSLLRSAANPRFDMTGFALQLGTTPDALTEGWHKSIRAAIDLMRADLPELSSQPRLLISEDNGAGRLNVGPRVSPDGRYIAFFSEKDRFSVDLYLASTETGKIERKLVETATDPHFDSLQFLNSAGAWRPDGRELVVTAVRAGRPVLAFIDPRNGKVQREIVLPELDDAMNPAWLPDARSLVVSGNRGGLTDLYQVELPSGRVTALTSDPFADLEPVVSPDGKTIVFVTERYSTDLEQLRPGALRLARLDLATKAVHPIQAFLEGKHLSPQISADGKMVTFIADPDGVSNLYRIGIEGGPVLRLTAMVTGIAGITTTSPALSFAPGTGRLAFSVFERDGHAVYLLDEKDTVAMVPPEVSRRAASITATAPVSSLLSRATGDVARLLDDPVRGLPLPGAPTESLPYKRGLKLDAISQPMVYAGVNSFGGFIGGSMAALFSDMLGDRILAADATLASDVDDLGGGFTYINRRHRWNWAASLRVDPYRGGYLDFEDSADGTTTTVREVVERQIYRGGSFATAFPFSTSTRFELAGSANMVAFNRDVRERVYNRATEELVSRNDYEETLAKSLRLGEVRVALVHDSSFYGATSPILGRRWRFETRSTRGSLQFNTAVADWRQYLMPVRPVTVAFRALHVGRYGRDAEHLQLAKYYAGHQQLIHGYGFGEFEPGECGAFERNTCLVFDRLAGSRLLVMNAEVRAPLLGLFRGEIHYGSYVPLEIAAFFDAGVAWSIGSKPALFGGDRDLVRSYGAALRANIFGFITLELAASRAIDRIGRPLKWQLGMVQGF
jgi:Tol biopolymer transport system component